MDDWQATMNLAKTVSALSERSKDVAKASKQESRAHTETSCPRRSRSRSRFVDSCRFEHRRLNSPDASDRNEDIDSHNIATVVSKITPREAAFASFKEPRALTSFEQLITLFVDRIVQAKRYCTRTPSEGA